MTFRYRALDSGGDMTFGQGSANFYVDSANAVAQAISTKLRLWTNEWFLNLNDGTPYLGQIIGRNTGGTYDQAIQDRILQVPGVVSITAYSSNVDDDRNLTISAEVLSIFGAQAVIVPLGLPGTIGAPPPQGGGGGPPPPPGQPVITVGIVASQVVNNAFAVTGTLGNYNVAPVLQYSVDQGNTWNILPSGAVITTTSFTFQEPGISQAGQYSVWVQDTNNPTIIGESQSFIVTPTIPTQAINVTNPGTQTGGVSFSVSGGLIGYTTPPVLQYSDDGVTWNNFPVGSTISITSFIFTQPALSSGNYNIFVRDANNTAVIGESAQFTVSAPLVITASNPGPQVIDAPITESGTLAGYTTVPKLQYSTDGGVTWNAIN